MKKNVVSVIVPIYNSEKFLRRCLDSIISQTYKNLEIILVDDGSTDDSLDICNSYCKKDSRITVIKEKNRGVSFARNVGLKIAKGDYVCFVDSDDSAEPNMVKFLLKDIFDNRVDMSICGYNIIGGVLNSRRIDNSFLINSREEYHNNYKIYQGYLWNKMFDTKIARKILFDEDIYCCEDELFVTKYVEHCNGFYYDSRKLYNHYNYIGSSSKTKEINARQTTQIEAKRREMLILEKYDFNVYKDYYVSYFLAVNDIFRRGQCQNVDGEMVKKMYRILLHNKNIEFRLKIALFFKYHFFWLYNKGKRVLTILKG